MEGRDVPDVLGTHDRFDDWITVVLVVVTLLGAAIAWGQAQAHFAHDEATARAGEWSVLANSQQSRANLALLVESGRNWQVRRDRIGAQQSTATALLGDGAARLAAIEAGQWSRRAALASAGSMRMTQAEVQELREIEAEAALTVPDVEPSLGRTASCEAEGRRLIPGITRWAGESGRDPPPARPLEASTVERREAFRMEGLRDAAEQTAVQAEDQFTTYAAALAFVAVALFLFGYALTKYGSRLRILFVSLGAVLTVGAVVVGVIALAEPPTKPPAAAAAAYADGQIALSHGELELALVDFACATNLNPGFASALIGRSEAVAQRGVQRGTVLINQGAQSDENLREALKYGRRARRSEPDDPRALAQIAIPRYIYGVREEDFGELRRAVTLNEKIEEELPRDPLAAINLAANRLALGLDDWRETYRRARRLMAVSSQRMEYAAGALTDLDALQRSQLWPGIGVAAREAKEEMVAAATLEPPPEDYGTAPDDRASLRDVQLVVSPAGASVGFRARRFHLFHESLFIAIYSRVAHGWQELPQLSGPVTNLAPPVEGHYEAGFHYASLNSCLGTGSYKAELYVEGRLANAGGIAEATPRLPVMRPKILPGINVRLCAPRSSDWQPLAQRTVGVVDGFERTGPRRAGIVVADLSAAPQDGGRALTALALERLSPPLPSGAKQLGPAVTGLVGESLTDIRRATYRYPGGAMHLLIGRTPIGRRLAIAVFGPLGYLTAQDNGMSFSMADSLLASVSPQDVSPFPPRASSGG